MFCHDTTVSIPTAFSFPPPFLFPSWDCGHLLQAGTVLCEFPDFPSPTRISIYPYPVPFPTPIPTIGAQQALNECLSAPCHSTIKKGIIFLFSLIVYSTDILYEI